MPLSGNNIYRQFRVCMGEFAVFGEENPALNYNGLNIIGVGIYAILCDVFSCRIIRIFV